MSLKKSEVHRGRILIGSPFVPSDKSLALTMTTEVSLLQQRRIEAAFIKPFLGALVDELGEDRAVGLVQKVIEGLAREYGRSLRGSVPPGLPGLAEAWRGFAAAGALDIEPLESSPRRFRIRVTRCRYAEMYHETGLDRWGAILSCGRDGPFAEGLCPEARLERSKTLMEGGPFCEFLYTEVDREDP